MRTQELGLLVTESATAPVRQMPIRQIPKRILHGNQSRSDRTPGLKGMRHRQGRAKRIDLIERINRQLHGISAKTRVIH